MKSVLVSATEFDTRDVAAKLHTMTIMNKRRMRARGYMGTVIRLGSQPDNGFKDVVRRVDGMQEAHARATKAGTGNFSYLIIPSDADKSPQNIVGLATLIHRAAFRTVALPVAPRLADKFSPLTGPIRSGVNLSAWAIEGSNRELKQSYLALSDMVTDDPVWTAEPTADPENLFPLFADLNLHPIGKAQRYDLYDSPSTIAPKLQLFGNVALQEAMAA